MRTLDDIGDFWQPSEGYLVDLLPDMPFERAVELERLTSMYLRERGLGCGPCPKEVLTAALNERTRTLVEEALSLVSDCEPVSLLTCLVAAYESLRIQLGSLSWGATGRLDVESSLVDLARSEAMAAPSLSISLRLAIELVSARPPAGGSRATGKIVTALWAYAYEVLNVGSTSDLVHHEVVPSELSAHAGRLILPELVAPNDAVEDRVVQLLGGSSDPYSSIFGYEPKTMPLTAAEEAKEKSLLERLGAATAEVAGLDLPACVRVIASLAAFAGLRPSHHPDGYNPGGLNMAAEDDLVSTMSLLHGEEPARVRALLRFLCIEPKPQYPDRADMPWVFGRSRSYQARPLIRVPGERDILWSGFHTYCSVDVIAAQLVHASLPGVERRSPLGRAMSEFSKWRGEQFEASVLDVLRSDLRLRARKIDKLNGKRLRRANGEDLGDIDALVADPASRTLLNIDAKASAPARTPREFADEIKRFTISGEGSDADRILERAQLVEENIQSALTQLGVRSDAEDWRVRSLVVLQAPPFAGKLHSVDLPTLSYEELAHLDLCQWIAEQDG